MGFIGAIVSDDDGWGGSTQGSVGSTTPDTKEKIQLDFQTIINDFLEKMKKLFNQNVYTSSQQYMFNKVVKLTKGMNLWKVKLSDQALQQLANALNESLKKASKPDLSTNVPTTTKPNSTTGNEGTEDEKVELITKICKQYCPEANAFGIAGMLGNFAHESGIDPTNFEAKAYWDG